LSNLKNFCSQKGKTLEISGTVLKKEDDIKKMAKPMPTKSVEKPKVVRLKAMINVGKHSNAFFVYMYWCCRRHREIIKIEQKKQRRSDY
jgi:hypothetical protein